MNTFRYENNFKAAAISFLYTVWIVLIFAIKLEKHEVSNTPTLNFMIIIKSKTAQRERHNYCDDLNKTGK